MKFKRKTVGLFGKYFTNQDIKKFSKNYNFIYVKEFEDYNNLKNTEYDIIFSYGYGKIFNNQFIKNCNCKIINFHGGYLPHGRGIYAQVWCLIMNKPTGFTVHEINNNEIDTGKIIFKKKILHSGDDTFETLFNKIKTSLDKYLLYNFENLIKGNFNYQEEEYPTTKCFKRKDSVKFEKFMINGWKTNIKEFLENIKNQKELKNLINYATAE